MRPKPLRLALLIALLLAGALAGWGLRACPDDPVAQPLWPPDPHAQWPSGCLIEGVSVHPTEPWLAVACTHAAGESGAVLVFDAAAGTLHAATALDSYVGWSDDAHLMQWHADGRRMTTNHYTNGITLLDAGRPVGSAFPDETRDHGVRHVWVGDQLFADTGALFTIRPGDWRFDLDPLDAPGFREMRWNPAIGAVVGLVPGRGLAAFDPVSEALHYEQPFDDDEHAGRAALSPDGRWCARPVRVQGTHSATEVRLHDGDDGRLVTTLDPVLPDVVSLTWGPHGTLAVHSRTYDPRTRTYPERHLGLFRGGEHLATVDLVPRRIEASYRVPEASGVAWSRDGDRVAVLLDQQQVWIVDAASGSVEGTFTARAPPIPTELPDWYTGGHRPAHGRPGSVMFVGSDRLVRLDPHFVSFWTREGEEVATFVVNRPGAGSHGAAAGR